MTEENIRPTLKSTNHRIDLVQEELDYFTTKINTLSTRMDILERRIALTESKIRGQLDWINALYGIMAAFFILVGLFGYFDGFPPYIWVSCAICGIMCIVGSIQTDKLKKGI